MKESIVGTRQGIYDVLYECDYKSNDNHRMFHVKCSKCGFETNMIMHQIKYVKNCQHLKANGDYQTYDMVWRNKKLSSIFRGMIGRCYTKTDKSYRWYGAKGIKVCKEWIDNPRLFEDWSIEHGYQDGLTIDRIDETKDYCPENCRWITREENAKYKSTTGVMTIDGKSYTGKDWAKICSVGTNVINTMRREHGEELTKEFIYIRLQDTTVKKEHNNWLKTYNLI